VISAYLFVGGLNHNEVANISYGKTKNVLGILKKVQEKTHVYIEPEIKNTAKCEIDIQCLNGNHIKSLGWKPKYNFDDGVTKTIEWYYNYFEGDV
jgi:nucleoside-diphosphate-sugar epimerase